MVERFATVSITLPRSAAVAPIEVPSSIPQEDVDRANEEFRRRIHEAYDTGMRVVAEQLRDLLEGGWRPDRTSLAEFCRLVELHSPKAKRS